MIVDSVMDDLYACADSFNEMISWLIEVKCVWGGYPDVSASYLTPDSQVILQIFHHNIHLAINPRILSKKHAFFIYAASKQMDIDLDDLLFVEIVTCMKNLWRVKLRFGRVPFEWPLVLGSLIYCMLKQQGVPIV